MALSNEELLQQVNMLATRTDDNKEMKFNKMPGINKGLNPEFFTGNNTKIVNAINKLATEVNALETAVVDMINKTNSVLMDVNSIENQEVWEETKRLMGEDTIIEGIRALLDGKMQDKVLNIDEEDEGKVLTVVIDDAGNPVVKPVDMGDIGTGGGNNGGGNVEDVISAYTVTYLNGEHPEMTNVGQAIDHIMDTIANFDFEVTWKDIKNKPKIGNKLELDEDSLNLLSNKDVELSAVPLMTDDDIFDLINDLD